jgi:hypothetical protein
MRSLIVVALVAIAAPAQAMNWEGHEDRQAFDPFEMILLEAIPEARPLPSRKCPVDAAQAAANPYEQIPLPSHGCGKPGAER